MSVESATKAGGYTDAILSENFNNIAKGFKALDNRLDALDSWFKHLEGHVGELYQAAQTATDVKVKTSSRVKPFIVGAVVGVVVYNYVKKNRHKIEVVMENANEGAKQRFAESVDKLKDQGADSAS